jgi:hypothetical protein
LLFFFKELIQDIDSSSKPSKPNTMSAEENGLPLGIPGIALPIEQFQNDTLRPVLKMLNDHLVALYRHFLLKRKVPFAALSKEKKMNWIADSLCKDNRLRGLVIGMVAGHFTLENVPFYLQEEGEINRRIINLATQRLQSQMEILAE